MLVPLATESSQKPVSTSTASTPLADDGRQATPSPCFPGQGLELNNWGRLQILWGTKVASCANEGSHVKYAVTGNITHFMALSATYLPSYVPIQRKRSRVTHLSRATSARGSQPAWRAAERLFGPAGLFVVKPEPAGLACELCV
jgi:hypothetical protein